MIARVLAAAASVLALTVLAVGFAITGAQDDRLPWWFVLVVALASAGLGYGVTRGPHRRPVLFAASAGLALMGLLGLLTIGLPLLLAAVLGTVAGARTAA